MTAVRSMPKPASSHIQSPFAGGEDAEASALCRGGGSRPEPRGGAAGRAGSGIEAPLSHGVLDRREGRPLEDARKVTIHSPRPQRSAIHEPRVDLDEDRPRKNPLPYILRTLDASNRDQRQIPDPRAEELQDFQRPRLQ